MGKNYKPHVLFLLGLSLFISACSQSGQAEGEPGEEEQHEESEIELLSRERGIELNELELTAYAEEIGFSLTSPQYEAFASPAEVLFEGQVEDSDELNSEELWLMVDYIGENEAPTKQSFNHYIPFGAGGFSEQIPLHAGEGEYSVTIRAPSNIAGEDDYYYDVAAFRITNIDEVIVMDVEYTLVGLNRDLILTSDIRGYQEALVYSICLAKFQTNRMINLFM